MKPTCELRFVEREVEVHRAGSTITLGNVGGGAGGGGSGPHSGRMKVVTLGSCVSGSAGIGVGGGGGRIVERRRVLQQKFVSDYVGVPDEWRDVPITTEDAK